MIRKILDPFLVSLIFNKAALARIEAAIRDAESGTSGEIRFMVEGLLPLWSALLGMTPRGRAEELFSKFRMWDTEEKSGVLIYLLLSKRQFEIVADRGITKKVSNERWQKIADEMEANFRKGQYVDGVVLAVNEVGAELKAHFHSVSDIEGNELPNRPELV